MLLAGCGTQRSGDPGGRRLRELAADPVFAVAPPGATDVRLTKSPAHYRKQTFAGGGWEGPGVVVTLASPAPPVSVYGFYGRRAAAAGWRPLAAGTFGVADRWSKTYADGAPATLSVTLLPGGSGAARLYRLAGAVPAVVR